MLGYVFNITLNIINTNNQNRIIKNYSINTLVNECLIRPILIIGAIFIAYAYALLAYLYLIFTSPVYNSDSTYTPVIIAFTFLIGL